MIGPAHYCKDSDKSMHSQMRQSFIRLLHAYPPNRYRVGWYAFWQDCNLRERLVLGGFQAEVDEVGGAAEGVMVEGWDNSRRTTNNASQQPGESGFNFGFGSGTESVPKRHEGKEGWIADSGATVHTKPSTDNMFDYVPAERGTKLNIALGEAIPIEGIGKLILKCEP